MTKITKCEESYSGFKPVGGGSAGCATQTSMRTNTVELSPYEMFMTDFQEIAEQIAARKNVEITHEFLECELSLSPRIAEEVLAFIQLRQASSPKPHHDN